jgi:hypothetical protein
MLGSSQRAVGLIVAVLTLLSLAGACGSGSVTSATDTLIPVVSLEASWTPVDALPARVENELVSFLGDNSLILLLPRQRDSRLSDSTARATGAGSNSSDVRLNLYLEGDGWVISETVRLRVSTPSCDERLAGDGSLAGTGATWEAMEVRGSPGCVAILQPPAVSFLEWGENATAIDIEWTGLSLEEVESWLKTWEVLP